MRPFNSHSVPVPRALQGTPFVLPQGPLDVEIGAGAGMHAIGYAAANPTRTLVALEHTATRFKAFRAHLETYCRTHKIKELPGLQAVQANAIGWITHALPPASVDRIFLLYPNPNPKNRAARWHAMPFFAKILEILKPGGSITLSTNLEWYATEARDFFTNTWHLKISIERTLTATDVAHARTHFEKKYLERGETCFEINTDKWK